MNIFRYRDLEQEFEREFPCCPQPVRLIGFQYLRGHLQSPVSVLQKKIGQVQVGRTSRFSEACGMGLEAYQSTSVKTVNSVM